MLLWNKNRWWCGRLRGTRDVFSNGKATRGWHLTIATTAIGSALLKHRPTTMLEHFGPPTRSLLNHYPTTDSFGRPRALWRIGDSDTPERLSNNMAKPVTTAVIAAAGQATRMWPASKVVPKELFPLGRVPAITHLVWELLDAGIRRVVLVVAKETSGLIRTLLDPSIRPPEKVVGDPLVQKFEAMLTQAEFTILHQSGPYGNAIPLIQAADTVGTDPCIYAFGDDIVLGENVTKGLIATFDRTGCPVLATQEVDLSRKSLFGIAECRSENGIQYISRLVEKPSPSETNSDLASFGRYLVTPDLMNILRTIPPGRDGELWFVDAVIRSINTGKNVCAFTLTSGKWYTVGDPASYAEAVRAASGRVSP